MVQSPVSFRWLAATLVASGALFATNLAQAHIELVEPLARYEITGADTGIKGCPCGIATGGGNSNRTCKVEQDGSDPNRNEERVYTGAAGSTLVIKFQETIGHTGKYRVAFDDDGADFGDFNEHVLVAEDDPQGNMGNTGNGSNWELTVTLPDTPCTNCTLQVIQVMDPSTLGAEIDGSQLASMSTYYSCIDLVITGDGPAPVDTTTGETTAVSTGEASEGEASSTALVSTETGDAMMTTGDVATTSVVVTPTPTTSAAPIPAVPPPAPPPAAPSTAPGSSTTGATPAAPTSGAPSDTGTGTAASDGGCTCRVGGSAHRGGFWATALGVALALGVWRRRTS